MKRLNDLSVDFDSMKLMAIAGIFVFHFFDSIQTYGLYQPSQVFQKIVHMGSQGIHIFFIFSAFFLYAKYSEKPDSFRILFRVKKLYPQYVTAVFVVVIIWAIADITVHFDQIIINLLPLIRNFSTEYIRSVNGNWWFLHTLIEFYLIFRFLLFSIARWGIHRLFGVAITIYFAYVLFYTFYLGVDTRTLSPYSTFVLNYIYDFIFGFYLYKYSDLLLNRRINPIVYIMIGGAFESIGYLLTQYCGVFGLNINDVFFALGWFYILFGTALALEYLSIELKRSLAASTAIIYLVYLIHHPIIISFSSHYPLNSAVEVTIIFIVAFLVTIILSTFLLKLIEFVEKRYA